MSMLNLKPTHAAVKKYYATLERFARGHFDKEGNIRGAFEDLLKHCARQYDWTLVPEYSISRKDRNPLSVDGALLDAFNLPRGYWEAKDTKDSLEAEMKKKFEAGYPRSNILFQRPDRALLFQDGRNAFNDSIEDAQKLVDVLRLFFEWRQPDHDSWDRAASEFSERIPEIAQGAMKLIDEERRTNRVFVERFAAFAELCRESINPDLKDEAVEEMLVQHLLTERIFRRIFDNPEFTRRNVIAAEIEKVIDSLTRRQFSRDAFLRELDPFYKAIEQAASTVEDYSEKQRFLNTIYERFFQGFNRKQADTHGIVYTPQPIVDFMVRSVEEILKTEFGRSLSDKEVHILDPFVGTGNFITRIMQEIKTSRLPEKYKEELHCNEIMLLPYYIASMNIEHAYLDRTGEYEAFEGICLVDTFQNSGQASFFTTENTRRIQRQLEAPIRVVIGNPPYNTAQQDENDQNKNRKYSARGGVDERVTKTYSKDSVATLRSKLSDPYVKAFRWATDRINNHGIVCFVSNSSFVDQLAFDGMRKHLLSDFSKIYVVDLGGNVRLNPKLSGTTHNVFGIQVGVAITLLIRHVGNDTNAPAAVMYTRMPEAWRKEERYAQLEKWSRASGVQWKVLSPDTKANWLTEGMEDSFRLLPAMASSRGEESLFSEYSLGVSTNRDSLVYDFRKAPLKSKVKEFIERFDGEVDRYVRSGRPKDIDSFVNYSNIQWSRNLKRHLRGEDRPIFDDRSIQTVTYRPFTKRFLYLQDILVDEPSRTGNYAHAENRTIAVTSPGSDKPFMAIASEFALDLHAVGPGAGSQCFPFYAYDEDGANRRENITDWALTEFRNHYGQKSITKRDLFHYTYALLHHPGYRTRYAANLKRELPRIPFVPDFAAYARIGAALMRLHLEYEQQREYPLQRRETGKLNWRVEKMSLSKDKTQLKYNDFLTLSDIPPEVYEYRLGNRSALEWVIDQYRVSTDKRSGIVNDPNRDDDPEYIVRLIGQVVTVSLETVRLVRELSAQPLLSDSAN